jgi:hypothetical protein
MTSDSLSNSVSRHLKAANANITGGTFKVTRKMQKMFQVI